MQKALWLFIALLLMPETALASCTPGFGGFGNLISSVAVFIGLAFATMLVIVALRRLLKKTSKTVGGNLPRRLWTIFAGCLFFLTLPWILSALPREMWYAGYWR